MLTNATDVLLFVSVVFRHGNRAPDIHEVKFLPKDQKSYDNFYPVGFGGLTNEGKQNEYKLGTKLRDRYNDFLGDVYIPEQVEARSTDIPRTKMSLDLVLAGLYPPSQIQSWNPELNWQPIPTSSVPIKQDTLLFSYASSPRYLDEVKRVESLPEVVKRTEKFRPLAKTMSKCIGEPINSVNDLWLLYHVLMSLTSTNHTLPECTHNIFPNGALLDAAALQYEIFNYNDLLKKLNGGMLLKRTIDNMITATKSSNDTYRRKLNLFSGHEMNVAALLATLGLYKPHVPEYSSAVILELIQRKDGYYVEVIHYLGIPAEFEEQELSDCGALCPLDKFINLMKKVTPIDEEDDKSQESE